MRYLRFALLGLLALAAACGTGGQEQDRTGIPEVDRIIDAVLSGDVDTVESLVILELEECSTRVLGEIPEPPRCPAGQPDGALIGALRSGACKPFFVAREEVPGFVRERLGTEELQVYAVYRTAVAATRRLPIVLLDTDYAIFFSAPGGPAHQDSTALAVAGGRIVWLTSPCASFADLARSLEEAGAEAVLPPPGAGD